ncbi:DUF190 domain-containing protein, partial [Acinetobacter baumannii]
LSVGLPIIILVIDETERIQRLVPALKEMISEGLMVLDEVESMVMSSKHQAEKKSPDAKPEHAPHVVSEYMNNSPVTLTSELT